MAKGCGFEIPVLCVHGGVRSSRPDLLAIEEPLEIRVASGPPGAAIVRPVSVTMRTPGHDAELTAGFLYTEGVISDISDIDAVEPWGPRGAGASNVVVARLRQGLALDWRRLERHFYASSSCGLCGKASIDAVRVCAHPRLPAPAVRISENTLHSLPDALRASQEVFDATGGLHAAALFTTDGRLIAAREDVGRHNAMDKLIGSRLMARDDLSRSIALVSGRASFELVQKAAVAGIPVLAAVGAPSSLAAELAAEFDMTLIGFLRDRRFNVYSGVERITPQPETFFSLPQSSH
jgi:FdhD protein